VSSSDVSFPDNHLLLSHLIDVLCRAAGELPNLELWAKHWKGEGDNILRLQDKVAAEAILLAYLASRVPARDPRLQDAIELLADRAAVHIATDRNEALLRRFPQTAATLGVGYVILARLGRGRLAIERILRQALGRGFASLSERSTFRLMDTRWTYGLLDPSLVRPVDELLPLSTFGASPHPIYTMSEDNYALTHAIYYLTDFGSRQASEVAHFGDDRLLDPFLAWTATRLDLDLLAEYLSAALSLRRTLSPSFRFAWQVLFDAWADVGELVGPAFSAARFAELSGEEADAYAFSENYHTQFVGGILCAVALTAPWPGNQAQAPGHGGAAHLSAMLVDRCAQAAARALHFSHGGRSSEQASRVQPGDLPEWIASRLLMAMQTPADAAPRWLRTAMDCDISREELASVLYDALIVEHARSYNLVQLTEALAVGAEHPGLRSETFSRGLEYLLDQQLDDGFVGINRLLAEDATSAGTIEAQAVIASLLTEMSVSLNRQT
jgi:hypothetical protein